MTERMREPEAISPEVAEWQTDEGNAECIAFQASMAQRIGDGEDLQSHPHMATCERCRSLVRDLEAIAVVARQLMPADAEPDEDLWTKIEKKLAMEDPEESAVARRHDDESASGALSMDGSLALEGGVA